jgi:hypothetical protein
VSVFSTLAATPSRMKIACLTTLAVGTHGVSRSVLVNLLTPRTLGPREQRESALGDDVVGGMTELGLLESGPNGELKPTALLRRWDGADITPLLEECLFADGSSDFAKTLAWFMLQDPGRPFRWTEDPRLRDETDAPDELKATARFQNFVYWAQALGYAWRVEVGDQIRVVPDPTGAIGRKLHELIGGASAPIGDFLDRVAETFVVLDGGAANREVLTTLPSLASPGTVSRSLTLALLRHERRGTLVFEHRSDALAWILQSWPTSRAVTHVRGRM